MRSHIPEIEKCIIFYLGKIIYIFFLNPGSNYLKCSECSRLSPHWDSLLSHPTLVFDEEMAIQRHRHLMESHCTGHWSGIDSRTDLQW